jgi:hypothetical protein
VVSGGSVLKIKKTGHVWVRTPGGQWSAKSLMISVVEIGYVRRSELKQAPGLNKIEVNCGSCHSLDYIPMTHRS